MTQTFSTTIHQICSPQKNLTDICGKKLNPMTEINRVLNISHTSKFNKMQCNHTIDLYNAVIIHFKSWIPRKFDFKFFWNAFMSSILLCEQIWSGHTVCNFFKMQHYTFYTYYSSSTATLGRNRETFSHSNKPEIFHQQRIRITQFFKPTATLVKYGQRWYFRFRHCVHRLIKIWSTVTMPGHKTLTVTSISCHRIASHISGQSSKENRHLYGK